MRKRLVPSALALLLVSPVLSTAPASGVVEQRGVAAPDYATEVFADPWDYSNSEDVLLDESPTMGLSAASIEGGLLHLSVARPGYFSPVWGGYPGALYLGREGAKPENQLDAGRFKRISFHAWSERDVPAGLMWFTCEGLDPACEGGQPFTLRAGWHTYDLELRNSGYGLPKEWAGKMTGLRLAMSPSSPTEVKFDWMRVYAPSAAVTVPSGNQWDVDDDPSDNTSSLPGWGDLSSSNLSFLPPGGYVILDRGKPVSAVRLLKRAQPVVLDPDEVGGTEYAAADPWDMNAPTDVLSLGNARAISYGPRLVAENVAAPDINDPFVWFRLRTPQVDTQRFHRVTIRSGYEGAFNLEDRSGGGAMSRVVWRAANQPDRVQQTADIVKYSGTRTVTLSLKQPGVHETDLEAGTPQAWAAAPATGIRWDPNEDRGPRRWSVDRFALRADDEAGSSFDVRWYDAGYAPGSTVTVSRADTRSGTNLRQLASGIVQRPGTNVYRWDSSTTPAGSYWIAVTVTGPAGSATSWSTGPVRVVPGLVGQGQSPTAPLTRDLLSACPQDRVPEDGFLDVPTGTVHEPAVDCVAWWGVTRPAGGYNPSGLVTRDQMASFLKRAVESTRGPLPAGADAFTDDDGSVHEESINALAGVGILGGFGDGTYRPGAQVTRAQMASFLVRAAEYAGQAPIVPAADYFVDDDGVHEVNVNKAAAAGIAGGTSDGVYSPAPGVRRDQMASFLARTLDFLVSGGTGAPPAR